MYSQTLSPLARVAKQNVQSPCTKLSNFQSAPEVAACQVLGMGLAKLEVFKSGRKLGTSSHGIDFPLERDRCDIKKKNHNFKNKINSLQLQRQYY